MDRHTKDDDIMMITRKGKFGRLKYGVAWLDRLTGLMGHGYERIQFGSSS